jgi:antitoxin CcdA
MGHARNAPKRALNVSISDDLVCQARRYTQNLSGTIESLLEDFVAREEQRRRAEDSAVEGIIDSFSAFHQQYGLLSDEFSNL